MEIELMQSWLLCTAKAPVDLNRRPNLLVYPENHFISAFQLITLYIQMQKHMRVEALYVLYILFHLGPFVIACFENSSWWSSKCYCIYLDNYI